MRSFLDAIILVISVVGIFSFVFLFLRSYQKKVSRKKGIYPINSYQILNFLFSPKRGVVFQPPSNMYHHYRTIGNPSMATMATIFPPPHEGMLQSPFPQQLGGHSTSIAVPPPHSRAVMPYQGVEYFNMLFPPNAYENLSHNPMASQQGRSVPTMKEPLFSDTTLPLPTDYSQQHLAFYNHH